MGKYILYAHSGSGNHGCEALARSTATLIGAENKNAVLVSANPDQDIYYGLDSIYKIVKKGATKELPKSSISFWKAYFALKVKKDIFQLDWLSQAACIGADKEDIALSIGGDTYCYGFTDHLIQAHSMLKYAGLKTVYWGCSIEPELLEDKIIAEDIQKFDLITARETISYEALKKIHPKVVLTADSAFILDRKDLPLPEGFDNCDLVGINSSPLIEESETTPGIARENYQNLIETILNNTNMKILLIPHVVWKGSDDRKVLKALYEKYAHTSRIFLVEDCNCEEIKGYIARCKYFIGARTHSTIAAYSSYVPTLVVGYSVKSRGIAKDLFGTDENYVLPVQKLKDKDDLSDNFLWLMSNGDAIRKHLQDILPDYCARIQNGVDALKTL